MSIKKIDKNELRGYEGKEGLIIQGCGGNPQEWVDGINELFTKEEILLDGTKFGNDNCAVFENDGLTCLLYEFNDDTKVDIGKLAMWRIGTHSDLGGIWLSVMLKISWADSVLQEQRNPIARLSDRTVTSSTLWGLPQEHCGIMGLQSIKGNDQAHYDTAQSYDEALGIIGEYVNITSVDDCSEDMDAGMEMRYD